MEDSCRLGELRFPMGLALSKALTQLNALPLKDVSTSRKHSALAS